MSVLSKFKNIKTQKETDRITWLYERHPLESAALDFRLQYLSALALLTALDREPTSDEAKAFAHLGNVLGVDESEAQGLLSERANVSEDDIETLFAALREQQASWNYLADLAWLHSIDGQADDNESATFPEAMHFLGLDVETTEGRQALQLPALMLKVQTADDKGFAALRYRATWPSALDAVLTVTTQKMLPVLEKNAVDLIFV